MKKILFALMIMSLTQETLKVYGQNFIKTNGSSLVTNNLIAQNKLIFYTESVDSLLIWMQKGCPKNYISKLINQPGNQLMETWNLFLLI